MLGHLHFFAENRPSSISPSPSQCCISGLKVHFFEATLTRGEGGRHFAQTRPSRASKTERLANACHIFRLSQGLLSRIVGALRGRELLPEFRRRGQLRHPPRLPVHSGSASTSAKSRPLPPPIPPSLTPSDLRVELLCRGMPACCSIVYRCHQCNVRRGVFRIAVANKRHQHK